MRPPSVPSRARYLCAIVSRAVAAAAGGYLLACAISVAIGLMLLRFGMTPTAALITANTLAFDAYATAALWAFACANATQAWMGIAVPTLLLAALATGLQLERP